MQSTAKLITDGLLVLGFGVQHSTLATLRVKRAIKARTGIEAISWRTVESLCNVVYILCAGAVWQHTDDVVWRLSGAPMIGVYILAVCSWLWYWQLHLFEYDCGLAFGSTTVVAELAGAPCPKLIPWKVGSRRWIRFPVHTAFFGMFFCIPTMTTDLLVLAMVINAYNVVGSVLYDRRLLTLAAEAYRPYQNLTGLIWPPAYRNPRGAADLPMPAPRHWRRPLAHLPGLAVGVGIGVMYRLLIGPVAQTPVGMLKAAGAGLLAAALSGLILGTVSKPDADEWSQRQTDLSTTVALSAAVGVITWAAIGWIQTGSAPGFAAFLPLWFIVQYLGHVFAYLAGRAKWSQSPGQAGPAGTGETARTAAAPVGVAAQATATEPAVG